MQTAFALDALRSSHPIEVPVRDALDIDQIFDRKHRLSAQIFLVLNAL
jgi:aminopeptidase N